MKIQKKLFRIASIMLSIGVFIAVSAFGIESFFMETIASSAKSKVDEENNRNMMEDVRALSSEISLFLTSYEDQIDEAMRNAAIVLQTQAAYDEITMEDMERITDETGMSDLYLFDKSGNTILSSVKEAEGFNLFTVWDGYQMLVTGESKELPSVIKIQVETGEIYKFTAMPSYDDQGNINGMVQSALNASEIERSVQSLVNENPMLTGLYLFEKSGTTLLSYAENGTPLSERGSLYEDQLIQEAYGGSNMLTRDENGRLYSYLPMERGGSPAYVLMLEIDQSYYTQNTAFVAASLLRLTKASSGSLVVLTVIFLVLILLTIGALTRYIGKEFVTPIESLCQTAHEVSLGNAWVRVDQSRSDEIGLLYSAFSQVVNGIQEQVRVVSEVSKGDFCKSLPLRSDHDELAQAINNMTALLSATISQIKQSASQIAADSQQVAQGAQIVNRGATEQVGAIEQLSALTNALSDKISANTANAGTIHQLTDKAGRDLQHNGEQMTQMVCAMELIGENGEKIIQTTALIDEIAMQTNILALNASIEAARAGEAGKAFSIVAEKVKELAVKCNDAASQISELVKNAVEAIGSGRQIARETESSVVETVTNTRQVISLVSSIAGDSEKQAKEMEQVLHNIDKINSVIQQTSAASQESSASAEELYGQAQILNELVKKFHLSE